MLKTFCYKFSVFPVIFMLIFSFSFVTNASTVIFSDGFESDFSNWTGNDPKWDTSGGNIHSGAKRGEVKGNTEPGDDVLLKNISTSGYDGITLEFWYRIKESLEDDDHVYFEWTGDGSNWSILNDFTAITKSDTWTFASSSLPVEADNKSNFAFRFRAHLGAVTSDIFYLDDVAVTGNSGTLAPSPISEPTPTLSPSPSPSPSVTPTPVPSVGSTNSPQATPVPPATTSIPTPTPTMTSSPKSSPLLQTTPTPSKTPTLTQVVVPSSKSSQPDRESSNPDKDLITASQLPESDNASATISNFFNNSKFFWLVSTMVLAVVLSLAKFKNN